MSVNILLSSAGRRVELLGCLRDALAELEIGGQIVATDASALTSAGWRADSLELVPRASDPQYLDVLLDLVKRHRIGLIVPTIDTELPLLASAADQLGKLGAHVLVSGPQTVEIGADKRATHEFLTSHDFPRPQQWSADSALGQSRRLPYPVIVKPSRGSSSVGVTVVHGPAELAVAVNADDDIVQSLAVGEEYTVDVWVDGTGRARSVVPRQRLEVRGGEVSKGVTARHATVISLAGRLAEELPDAYGPLTIQIIAHGSSAEVIEVNPRFGGGYPLSFAAGARTAVWAIQDTIGQPLQPHDFPWSEGLTMLRFDQSVFVEQSRLQA